MRFTLGDCNSGNHCLDLRGKATCSVELQALLMNAPIQIHMKEVHSVCRIRVLEKMLKTCVSWRKALQGNILPTSVCSAWHVSAR